MPALDSITIQGFKSIASVEQLSLRPINVLIGPNGCGKSNFIGVFSFLHSIREGHLQAYILRAGGAEKILHFGSKVTQQIRIHLSFQDATNQYELSLGQAEVDTLVPRAEYGNKLEHETQYRVPIVGVGREAGISIDAPAQTVEGHVQRNLDSWRLYHFHDTSISSPAKRTADLNDNRYLRPDGSNVAAFLYFLKLKHPVSYSLIRRTIKLVAPFLDDFLLEPLQLNLSKIRLEWRHQGTDAYFDASSLSDGTLRFLLLATLFLQPSELLPSIILVDEPELGLHPYAVSILASLIKRAATSGDTQVIISTQSPILLDYFEPEDVLVASHYGGDTRLVRLEAEPLAAWLEEYSLGQLWEKNELGGRLEHDQP